jgi:hypothetical protein
MLIDSQKATPAVQYVNHIILSLARQLMSEPNIPASMRIEKDDGLPLMEVDPSLHERADFEGVLNRLRSLASLDGSAETEGTISIRLEEDPFEMRLRFNDGQDNPFIELEMTRDS